MAPNVALAVDMAAIDARSGSGSPGSDGGGAPLAALAASAVAVAVAVEAVAAEAEPSSPPLLPVALLAPALLAPGEPPPPTYRTRLPPSQTLRYEVRSGFLRGTGELRWRSEGGGYRVDLEARVAGLTLLRQSSEGRVDAAGLAPDRFVDQRARRPRQAANFRRDAGRITFSGPAKEWPLLPGSQDRLGLFVQLAAVAAANPSLRVEGGRIAMVVVGARGDASVWTFRSAGPERIETGLGPVQAIRFVREPGAEHDTRAEIWLDPQHDFLPAHATLRNGGGAAEYELLLQGVEAAP